MGNRRGWLVKFVGNMCVDIRKEGKIVFKNQTRAYIKTWFLYWLCQGGEALTKGLKHDFKGLSIVRLSRRGHALCFDWRVISPSVTWEHFIDCLSFVLRGRRISPVRMNVQAKVYMRVGRDGWEDVMRGQRGSVCISASSQSLRGGLTSWLCPERPRPPWPSSRSLRLPGRPWASRASGLRPARTQLGFL